MNKTWYEVWRIMGGDMMKPEYESTISLTEETAQSNYNANVEAYGDKDEIILFRFVSSSKGGTMCAWIKSWNVAENVT